VSDISNDTDELRIDIAMNDAGNDSENRSDLPDISISWDFRMATD
jgi:hypothetical protein